MEEKGERRMREKEACRKIQEWSLWRRGGYWNLDSKLSGSVSHCLAKCLSIPDHTSSSHVALYFTLQIKTFRLRVCQKLWRLRNPTATLTLSKLVMGHLQFCFLWEFIRIEYAWFRRNSLVLQAPINLYIELQKMKQIKSKFETSNLQLLLLTRKQEREHV
jgi:hypothetical protein